MEYQINLTEKEITNYLNLDCQQLADDMANIGALLDDIDECIFDDDIEIYND